MPKYSHTLKLVDRRELRTDEDLKQRPRPPKPKKSVDEKRDELALAKKLIDEYVTPLRKH